MKTSRPQVLAQPPAKWGSPAARLGTILPGSKEADLTNPYICKEHKARSWVKAWPLKTNSEHCSIATRRAALYASETTIAKYFGRRNEGTEFLMGSNRVLNHSAALARFGRSFTCLRPVSKAQKKVDSRSLPKKAVRDVVQCPSPFTEVRTERVTEIVVLHYLTKRSHPSLQSTVGEFAESGYIVSSLLAVCCNNE